MNRSQSVLKFFIFLVTIVGLAGAWNIRLAEDARDLLPGPSVSNDLATLQKLGVINRIFISLEADEIGKTLSLEDLQSALKISAEKIGSSIAENNVFSEVFYRLPENYEIEISNIISSLLPSLIDSNDLESITERLEPARLEKQLKDNFFRLNTLAGIALTEKIREDPLDLTSMVMNKFMALKGGMKMTVRDGFFFSNDGRSCLIWAESILPLTSSENAAQIMDELQKVFNSGLSPGVRIGIAGALPHTLANAETIKKDLKKLLPAALLFLSFFLLLFLKTPKALLVVAIPFLAIPPAVALMSFFFTTVSSLALGFGIVLLGIGVDFAVHIFLGCAGKDEPAKIPVELKRTVLTAALTTISVFIVLMFSEVPSHKQMAFLAVAGLSWALFLSWIIVPDIASGYVLNSNGGEKLEQSDALRGEMSGAGARVAVVLWLILLTAALFCAPGLRYNGDMKSLDAPSEKVRADEDRFIATWGHGHEQAFIVSGGDTERNALDMNDRVYLELQKINDLYGVQSIAPIVPGPERQKRNSENWDLFWEERLVSFSSALEEASVAAGFTAGAFRPFLDSLQKSNPPFKPEVMIKGPLRPLLRSLMSEDKGKVGKRNLLVATLVPDNKANEPFLEDILKKVEGVRVISNSRWRAEVEKLLAHDILRLSLAAGLVVIMICMFFFRDAVSVFAVLAPVIAALAAMIVYIRVTGGELNIMHVLMGIMVIGISVDYGIFIVRSFKTPVSATSFKAVTVCAVSTLTGFGVLALASHPALKALGLTVLVGIGASWPAALLVSPAFLGLHRSGR